MAVQYDDEHFLLTFGGYLVGGHEQWQCGLRYAGPSGVPDALWTAALSHIGIQDIWTIISVWMKTATSGAAFDPGTSLEFAKLAFIGTDGNYKADAIEYRAQQKGVAAQGNSSPPQLSVVVSLSSGSRIGNANHGRIYLPLPAGWALGIEVLTGKIIPAYVTALTNTTKTMLEAIHGEVSTVEVPTQLSIFSPKTPKSKPELVPSHKPVVRLGIGPTVDTQRSRRRSLPDGITTWSTYAPTGG
jgi:hypothetical protein